MLVYQRVSLDCIEYLGPPWFSGDRNHGFHKILCWLEWPHSSQCRSKPIQGFQLETEKTCHIYSTDPLGWMMMDAGVSHFLGHPKWSILNPNDFWISQQNSQKKQLHEKTRIHGVCCLNQVFWCGATWFAPAAARWGWRKGRLGDQLKSVQGVILERNMMLNHQRLG